MATIKKPVKKEAAAKPAKTAKADSNTISLAEICDALGVKPATARVKLRSSEFAAGAGARWVWTKGSKEHKGVEALLKGKE